MAKVLARRDAASGRIGAGRPRFPNAGRVRVAPACSPRAHRTGKAPRGRHGSPGRHVLTERAGGCSHALRTPLSPLVLPDVRTTALTEGRSTRSRCSAFGRLLSVYPGGKNLQASPEGALSARHRVGEAQAPGVGGQGRRGLDRRPHDVYLGARQACGSPTHRPHAPRLALRPASSRRIEGPRPALEPRRPSGASLFQSAPSSAAVAGGTAHATS
jgi:hypothetical protein